MRNIPGIFYLIFLGFLLTGIVSFYMVQAFKQDEQTLLLNEAVATYVPTAVEVGKSRIDGLLFLNKSKFENELTQAIRKKYANATLAFLYLEEPNGAVKALKVTMEIDDLPYTTTYKVNEK